MVHPNACINFGKGASKSILVDLMVVRVWLYKNTGLVWFIPMRTFTEIDTCIGMNHTNHVFLYNQTLTQTITLTLT